MDESADRPDRSERKVVEEGDLIQVNEDGPPHWFRCILVVDGVESWGIHAFCTSPGRTRSIDYSAQLEWGQFDVLGVKSHFRAAELMMKL